MIQSTVNPFFASRCRHISTTTDKTPPVHAVLPEIPASKSPVPHLTSLYHLPDSREYGDAKYPGNCGGNLIKDLLTFFRPGSVLDPMTGSGTCRDVCKEREIYCWSSDLHQNVDACDTDKFPRGCFDFCWIHPPYWRQKLYSNDPRDLSRTSTLEAFLERYKRLISNCARSLTRNGKLVILIGDYIDHEAGFIPLTYHTKRLAFELGLSQHCTDIIRFGHGASSGRRTYSGSFIPQLHDVCMIFTVK